MPLTREQRETIDPKENERLRESIHQHIGSTLRDLRMARMLSQRAAAKACGISYVHLCNCEGGHAQPSFDLLDKLSALYGVDVYVLAWARHADLSGRPRVLQQARAILHQILERRVVAKAATPAGATT